MMTHDALNENDEKELATLLNTYKIEEPRDDFTDNILRKAAMYPRQEYKRSFIDYIFAPFRAVFFSKEYMPVTFAIVMFCLMVLITVEDRHNAQQTEIYNDYATLLIEYNEASEMVASLDSDGFPEEFSDEMRALMISDLEDSFDI